MTYFLDFDRTLFDFDAFFLDLVEYPALAGVRERALEVVKIPRGVDSVHDEKRNKMWEEVHTLYSSGAFSFEDDALSRFVFPDAKAFLEKHGKNSIVITKGGLDLAFQQGKVISSGVGTSVLRCEYVQRDDSKGELLSSLLREYPAPYVFVDDFGKELESVAELCPEVSLYEIRRDGKPGSGEYAVIRSLAELP
jgi:hypothetical protein